MDVISRALHGLVAELLRRGLLVLVDGSDATLLAAEVEHAVRGAGGYHQAGGAIGRALLGSPLVDEVFASDREIVEMLGEIEL